MSYLFHYFKESEVVFASAFIDENLRVILLCEVITRLLVKDGNTFGVEELAPVEPSLEVSGPG